MKKAKNNIEERLVRQSDEDKIYIGEIVERTYYGQFGAVLTAIVNALITEGLTYHTVNEQGKQPLSAERILGRLEGYQRILTELELSIEKRKELTTPIEEEEDEEY